MVFGAPLRQDLVGPKNLPYNHFKIVLRRCPSGSLIIEKLNVVDITLAIKRLRNPCRFLRDPDLFLWAFLHDPQRLITFFRGTRTPVLKQHRKRQDNS